MGNPTTQDWLRLEVLILRRACTLLRKQFRRYWKQTRGVEWVDGPEFGAHFLSSPLGAGIHRGVGRLHRMTLEEGDVDNWDFSLLSKIFEQFPNDSSEAELEDLFKIQSLILSCKKAIRHPTKLMEDPSFSATWDEIERILVSFGENEKSLEKLKRAESVSEEDLSPKESAAALPTDPATLEEVRGWRERGKELLGEGDYEAALASLTQGISILQGKTCPPPPVLELGALYAVRSDAYLRQAMEGAKDEKISRAYMSLRDAKHALFLRPAWGLAYYRVGSAYVELGKLKKASKYLDQALELEPNVEEIQVAKVNAKRRLGSTAAFIETPALAPHIPSSPRPLPGGTRLSPEVSERIDSIFFPSDEDNILGEIYKAHKLRDKGSYREAANLYRKGVKYSNAEAMYNLALLKLEGRGIKQDVRGGIDLLKRAGKQPKAYPRACSTFSSNVGVPEASFLLGLLSSEGIGYPPQRDWFSAAVYYQEGAEHGHGPSATNLGILYATGRGVVQDRGRAVQLWKLGATRKVPQAMHCLSIHHAQEWEGGEGRKWLLASLKAWEEEEAFGEISTKPEDSWIASLGGILQRIEEWRGRYGMKEIGRWEVGVGIRGASPSNLPMKARLSRMLHNLSGEKEKIEEVEGWLRGVEYRLRGVELPFHNAKAFMERVREGMFLEGSISSRGSSRSGSQSRSCSSASGGEENIDSYASVKG